MTSLTDIVATPWDVVVVGGGNASLCAAIEAAETGARVLLLEGAPEDIKRLADEMELVDVSHPTARAFRRGHAPVAIGAMGAIVVLAALGVAPILALAVMAVAALA